MTPEESGKRHATHVWVLAGSIGSIVAAGRFFRKLPPDHPLAFVLAIRGASDWAPLMVNLFTNTTSFRVRVASAPEMLQAGEVVIVPTNNGGYHEFPPLTPARRPSLSIDDVLMTVAERYERSAGVIFLSGISGNGVLGCRAILRHGGRVWTQDFESCQFSSLPRYVRDHCEVSFAATPEALAARVAALTNISTERRADSPWFRPS